MFNHQYNFDIEIPKEVITKNKHDKIDFSLLENKVIIGLCGYGKSGKDAIAKHFIKDYGFHRVAFADNIKIEMNENIKEAVYNDLENTCILPGGKSYSKTTGLNLEDGRTLTLDMIDFLTEDIPVKKALRPYIIWYGEKLREINGANYWINQAFAKDAKGHDRIILSDVRRLKELDIFRSSNSFKKKTEELFAAAGCVNEMPNIKTNSYSTLLFHVNQLGLTDKDVLTVECIQTAIQDWLFDFTFYTDPRLPEKGGHREKAINHQIGIVKERFGISKPDKTISPRQTKIF